MRDANRYTRHTTRVQADEDAASRERSAAIFGNRYFAEVVLAVDRLSAAGDAFVTTRMVASDTALGDSLVRPVMHRLDAAGLIAALPRTGGPRSTLNYQVVRRPLWSAVVTVSAETVAANAAPQKPRA
jgi:hypothetical protein